MRIAVLIEKYPPIFAGPTPTLVTLYSELIKRRHDVAFLTPLYSSAHPRHEDNNGINVIRIAPGIHNNWTELRFVFNSLWYIWKNKVKPDILIDTKPFGLSMILTQAFSYLFGLKVVARLSQVGTCDPIAAMKGRAGILRKLFVRRYNRYICISPALSKICERAGINKRKISLIPNCVDTDKYSPIISERERDKKRHQLLPNAMGPIIMVPGSVSPRKRPHLALDAWRIIKEKYKLEGTLIFVGPIKSHGQDFNDEYFSNIKQKIHQFNLKDSVIFTGLQRNMDMFYKISDVVFFVSRREGLPNVILESLSSGCPVVCSKITDITDFVYENSVEGFITTDKPKNMARKLSLLMTNSNLREKMGLAGREKALKTYRVKKIANDIDALIKL